MPTDARHVVLDTNTILHFKRPDQIDWISLLNCSSVVIVITPTLVRELEKQKVDNRSKKTRKRADATIRWLGSLSEGQESPEIRPGVTFSFIRYSPSIDFNAHKLSHAISDDELIAHTIEYRDTTDANVVMVTNDLGLRMKLPPHNIPALRPREEDKLPEELDESEEEIVRLQKTLARIQARGPRLALTFRDGKMYANMTVRFDMWSPIRSSMSEASWEYARTAHRWKNDVAQYLSVRLTLENKGTAAATDIHIDFALPEFVRPFSEDDYPSHPSKRTEPTTASSFPRWPSSPTFPGELVVDSNFREVSYRIPSLVHHRRLYLPTFFLRFVDLGSVQNFSAIYRIGCVEDLNISEDELHFKVDLVRYRSNEGPWL